MAEREVDETGDTRSACDSTYKSDCPGDTVPPKSSEDESSESPASQHAQDLKSVLVTSVLNLEKLDVDLYR